MNTKSKEVAKAAKETDKQVVAAQPDYIKKDMARGAENVTMDDVALPRIEVIQALSPEIKTSDPLFIKGSVQGDLFNTITRRLYGPNVVLVPVYFQTQWLVWKDRKKGGGFRGAFDTVAEANAQIVKEIPADERQHWAPQETKVYICLRVDQPTDDHGEEVTISLSRTKLKVARHWNSLSRMAGGDLFSRLYNVFSVDAKNDQGEFKNYNVQLIDSAWPSRGVYEQAEALYTAIKTGKKRVRADMTGAGDEGGDAAGETEF